MTSPHKRIRIIERKQREISVANKAGPFEKTAQQIERELVRTVKSWIDGRRKVLVNLTVADNVDRELHLSDDQ